MIAPEKLKKISELVWERIGLPEDKNQAKSEDFLAARYFLDLLMITGSSPLLRTSWQRLIEVMRALADGIELIMQEDMKENGN